MDREQLALAVMNIRMRAAEEKQVKENAQRIEELEGSNSRRIANVRQLDKDFRKFPPDVITKALSMTEKDR